MNLPKVSVAPILFVTVLLMPILYFTVYQVLTGHFSVEIQSMTVGAVLGGLLGSLTGFWLQGTMGQNHAAPTPTEPAASQPSTVS